jgi:hypothetical protein
MALSCRKLLATAGASLLAGCPGGDDVETVTPADPPEVPTRTPEEVAPVETLSLSLGADPVTVGVTPPPETPPNAPPQADRRLPAPFDAATLFEYAMDGGVPKDGIPAIDEPEFQPPEAVDHHPATVVFGVVRNGEPKAYPRGIVIRHEVVNDVVGGDPVSVTFCPLTGTALGFERGETTFGVSGLLLNSNLVMYDRARERLWPQMLACSIPGWADTPGGAILEDFEVVRTSWRAWQAAHPETVVLSEDTGYVRQYWIDPYGERGYYHDDEPAFPSLYSHDARHAKDWVYGVRTADGAVAFGREALAAHGVIHGEVGGEPVVAIWDQSLETARVYHNPEGRAYGYDADGSVVAPDGDRHDPGSLDLERLHAFDALWFAWVGLYPTSTLYH